MYEAYSYEEQVKKILKAAASGIPIAVIDLETTGKSCNENYVFEFAGVKLAFDSDGNATVLDKAAILMRPAEALSPKITEITGFKNSDLIGKPSEAAVFGRIESFMADTIMCAHNAPFERGFMTTMYLRNDQIFSPMGIIDTLKMSRDLHKKEKSHKLSDIADRYKLSGGVRFHDARGDVVVTAKLLEIFIKEYLALVPEKQEGKIVPKIASVRFWTGKSHTMQRLYIATNVGVIWFSTWNRSWGEKDKGTLDAIDMNALQTQVLAMTKCSDLEALQKFRGSITC